MERAVAEREIRRFDMGLKLYRISQTVNTGYDTYDSAVVVAESEDAAREIHHVINGKGEPLRKAHGKRRAIQQQQD